MTWIQIPIPVKLTLYVGDPIEYDLSKDSIDDVSKLDFFLKKNLIDIYRFLNDLVLVYKL
jgi:hypothetical protein